ncbi:hypothetical protein D3C76_1487450 [compost metagenome]
MSSGKRAWCCAQGNLPESTTMPPMLVPWPPMYLVSECTTMSAPCSNGRHSTGVATVLSTISGTPWRCAASARACRSTMLPAGLPMDSQNTALVRSSISASSAGMSSWAAKRVWMPKRGRVCASRL